MRNNALALHALLRDMTAALDPAASDSLWLMADEVCVGGGRGGGGDGGGGGSGCGCVCVCVLPLPCLMVTTL